MSGHAGLAQLAERETCNFDVVGSIPTPGSKRSRQGRRSRYRLNLAACGYAEPMHPTSDQPGREGDDPLLPDIDPEQDPNVIVPFPDPTPDGNPGADEPDR